MTKKLSPRDVLRLRNAVAEPHELLTTADGRTLFLRHWPGVGSPEVSVLILHGITAHSGAYGTMLGHPLSAKGIDMWGLDLRGHGLSDGRRGDYPSRKRLEEDLAHAVTFVARRSKRLVVLGHSLGVMTAIAAYQAAPQEVQGLVLLSAAREINPAVFPSPTGGGAMKAILGALLFRGWPLIEYRRTGQSGHQDPLYNFRYSARFYEILYGTGIITLADMMQRGSLDVLGLRPSGPIRVPVLVGVGDQDEIFSVRTVQDFCQSLPAEQKQLFVVPGARHAKFPTDGWGALVGWLSQLSARSTGNRPARPSEVS